jgi:hypothetical protein
VSVLTCRVKGLNLRKLAELCGPPAEGGREGALSAGADQGVPCQDESCHVWSAYWVPEEAGSGQFS